MHIQYIVHSLSLSIYLSTYLSTYVYVDIHVYVYQYIYMVPPPSDLPFVVVLSTFYKGSGPENVKIPQTFKIPKQN